MSYSRKTPDQRGDRHEESQRESTRPDGLLSRYTSKFLAVRGYASETTHNRDRERTQNLGRTRDQDRTQGHDRTRDQDRTRPRALRLGILIVRQGKESESDRAFEVRQDRMTIGRSSGSDIALEDEAVSRVHAVVLRDEDGTHRICDQNSANGTYVNSQRISEYVLEDGDEIQVGLMVLKFRLVEPY